MIAWIKKISLSITSGLITLAVLLGASASKGAAQIVPDETLGNERSQVIPRKVQGIDRLSIEGGARKGQNLFHSFSDFNVGNGTSAYFANPSGVSNILSRVTGPNASTILGKLGVDGGANLVLINPNGITFGTSATLDIRGSFTASTAESFTFPGGETFSAVTPVAAPEVAIVVPVGLQMGTRSQGIDSIGNLRVGQNFSLVGKDLNLQGQLESGGDMVLKATNILKAADSLNNPLVVSAGGQLLLQGDRQIQVNGLSNAGSGLFSGNHMSLRSDNTIENNIAHWSAGDFSINKINGDLGDFSGKKQVVRSLGNISFRDHYGTDTLSIWTSGSIFGRDIINKQSGRLDIQAGLASSIIENDLKFKYPTINIFLGDSDNQPRIAAIKINDIISRSTQVSISNIHSSDKVTNQDIEIGTIRTRGDDDFDYTAGSITINGKNNIKLKTADNRVSPISISSSHGNIDAGGLYTRAFRLDGPRSPSQSSPITVGAFGDIKIGYATTYPSSPYGSSGNIDIKSSDGNIYVGGINATADRYRAGSVTLEAKGNISTGLIRTNTIGAGTGGTVSITSHNGDIVARGRITTEAEFSGGSVFLNAKGDIYSSDIITQRGGEFFPRGPSKIISIKGNSFATTNSELLVSEHSQTSSKIIIEVVDYINIINSRLIAKTG